MSLRDSQFGELKVPLTWTAAVALIVAAVVAVALLLTDRRETFRPEAYGQTRSKVDGVLAPVGEALSAPVRWTGEGVEAVRGYFFAVSVAEARERNRGRVGRERVPDVAIYTTAKRLTPPTFAEGFDRLNEVSLTPDGAFAVRERSEEA